MKNILLVVLCVVTLSACTADTVTTVDVAQEPRPVSTGSFSKGTKQPIPTAYQKMCERDPTQGACVNE